MGAILGRQSDDCGRSRILVYGSLVQELLIEYIDANMIIVESKMNSVLLTVIFHSYSIFTFI